MEESRSKDDPKEKDALERMDEALKATLNTLPRKHEDEPKRRRCDKSAASD